MKNPNRRHGESGLTWVEVLIAVAALVLLVVLVAPALRGNYLRSVTTQALSNMKQLHLATQQMAMDGMEEGDKAMGWPGTNSYQAWVSNLVPSYLGTNDFLKLMSKPETGPIDGLQRWWTGPPLPASMVKNTNMVLVYGVTKESGERVVCLSSGNFINTAAGGVLRTNVAPLGGKIFVVIYKGGDGAILLPKQLGDTNAVGGFVPLLR